MALKLGIGDALTLCKGAVDLCSAVPRVRDESKEVQSVVAEMKLMKAHLKSLETQVGDEKAFVKGRPDIAPIIKRSLEPLHRDLLEANETLHHCTHKPSVHVLDKVRYLVLYKAKLEAFRQKLPEHRASMAIIQELIEGESPSDRRTSTIRLTEIVENREEQQKQQDEYNRAQEEVLKRFEDLLPRTEESRQLSSQEILSQLENDLVRRGSTREQAGQQLFPIAKALLIHPVLAKSNLATTRMPSFKLDIFESTSHISAEGSPDGSRSGDYTTHKRDGSASSQAFII